MSLLAIKIAPDEVLRQKAKPIRSISDSIRKLANDMLETMHFASGVGLAAPQVGVSLRLVVVEVPEEEPLFLVNPLVLSREGSYEVTEGCLSIPGYRGEIQRSEKVTVRYRDLDGNTRQVTATELLAQALEHEIDHLDGVLYTDHLQSPDKLRKIEPDPDNVGEAAAA